MDFTFGQLLGWLIIGALVGVLVGRLVHRSKRGFGLLGNLVLGLVGAVVGGVVFDLLDINIGADLVITGNDLVAAFVGSLIVLAILWVIRR